MPASTTPFFSSGRGNALPFCLNVDYTEAQILSGDFYNSFAMNFFEISYDDAVNYTWNYYTTSGVDYQLDLTAVTRYASFNASSETTIPPQRVCFDGDEVFGANPGVRTYSNIFTPSDNPGTLYIAGQISRTWGLITSGNSNEYYSRYTIATPFQAAQLETIYGITPTIAESVTQQVGATTISGNLYVFTPVGQTPDPAATFSGGITGTEFFTY